MSVCVFSEERRKVKVRMKNFGDKLTLTELFMAIHRPDSFPAKILFYSFVEGDFVERYFCNQWSISG
jgi:hypothetical protein